MQALKRVAKVGLCLAIFVLVLRAVGTSDVVSLLAGVDLRLLFAAQGLALLDAALRGVNWAQLLNSLAPCTMRQGIWAYFAGAFYGAIIPSTVGTDVARAVTAARYAKLDLRLSAASLVTLNIIGLGSVGAVGAISGAILSEREPSVFLLGSIAFGVAMTIGVIVLLLTSAGRTLVEFFSKLTRVWSKAEKLLKPLMEALLVAPNGVRERAMLITIAIVNQILRVAVAYLVARSLGMTIDWWILAAVAPLAAVVEMIPLSFLGFGIGQGAMVYFLSNFGVASSEAFALSSLVALMYVGTALAGGVFVLLDSISGENTEISG